MVDSVPIRSALILLAIVSVAGMPYTVLMPAVTARQLHGGPNTLGWLMAAGGAGALMGGIYLASRETVVGLGRVILVGTFTFGGRADRVLAHVERLAGGACCSRWPAPAS